MAGKATLGHTFTATSGVTVRSGADLTVSGSVQGTGRLLFEPGSTGRITGTMLIPVTNQGTLTVWSWFQLGPDGGPGGTFTNDGALTVQSPVRFGIPGDRLINNQGGTITFTGYAQDDVTVPADLQNRGRIEIRFPTRFTGTHDLAGGTIAFVVASWMYYDGIPLWHSDGPVALAGALTVEAVQGTTVPNDSSLWLLTAGGTITGSFASITTADPAWSVRADAAGVRLSGPASPVVTPPAPTLDDPCSWEFDGFTIPAADGVDYYYNGAQLLEPGDYVTGDVSFTITAKPRPGYVLGGTTQWSFTFTDEACPQLFTDVPPSAAFYHEIGWLARAGVSTGWVQKDGTAVYQPLSPVNRDAMAAFLYRLAGEPTYQPPAMSPFLDVTPTTQFYKEICWLAEQGITTGWTVPGGKEFRPVTPIARDAMAAFMYRFAGEPAYDAPVASPFLDVAPGAAFYREIAWLADNEISTGWTVNGGAEYRPAQTVKRDAMAAFLYRLTYNVLVYA